MIGIDKNVEMPKERQGHMRYPWHTMDVVKGIPPRGDSFLVRCDDSTFRKIANSLTSCIRELRLRHGKLFTMRRVDEGVRVWRTK